MIKIVCLCCCLFTNCFLLFSQAANIITGKITSSASGHPVPACSVFIANSSKGTISDSAGEFTLKNVPQGNYDLVVSSIGYETLIYTYKASQLPLFLEVSLTQKEQELSSVTVEPTEKNGWQKWGKFFLDNFIGTTENAANCQLINKKSVRFRFSKKNNTLTALSDEPLLIENKALGYHISYQLEEFQCDFNSHLTLFLGYPLFSEMEASGHKKSWSSRKGKGFILVRSRIL